MNPFSDKTRKEQHSIDEQGLPLSATEEYENEDISKSTTLGDIVSKINSTYNKFGGSKNTTSKRVWTSKSDPFGDDVFKTDKAGKIANSSYTITSGGHGSYSENSVALVSAFNPDGSFTNGKISKNTDTQYFHDNLNSDGNLTSFVRSSDPNGNTTGVVKRISNVTSSSYEDLTRDNSSRIWQTSNADGSVHTTEQFADKTEGSRTQLGVGNVNTTTKWASVDANGTSQDGKILDLADRNINFTKGFSNETKKNSWGVLELDGSVKGGNDVEVTKQNYTNGVDETNGTATGTWIIQNKSGDLLVGNFTAERSIQNTTNLGAVANNNVSNWANLKPDGNMTSGQSKNSLISKWDGSSSRSSENSTQDVSDIAAIKRFSQTSIGKLPLALFPAKKQTSLLKADPFFTSPSDLSFGSMLKPGKPEFFR